MPLSRNWVRQTFGFTRLWPTLLVILLHIFLLAILFPDFSWAQLGGVRPPPPPPVGGQNVQPGQVTGQLFTGTGTNPYYGVNLVPFGPENGDLEVAPGFLTSGQTIDTHLFFPFYGGLYNYTTISVNGYMAFATVLDQGPTINVGPDSTDWPRVQDPAMIAPYLCKQQITQDAIPGLRTGVFFRLVLRQTLFGRGAFTNLNQDGSIASSAFFGQNPNQACPSTAGSYVRCDANSDYFLDEMMRWLQEGVAGASMFRADAAVIVTWYNTASAVSGRSDLASGQLSTYQTVWLTDQPGRLSYVILNYDKLGFDAADFRQNSRSGRCRALFNGGNHTGYVDVDPTQLYKNTPKILAQRSGVPSMVRGRYMFRVDDVVRPGGCSNKTGGTYPMLIYPNIVNMLGDMTIDVNAMCLDRTQTYILMIEQRMTATCMVLNPSIARCNVPKIYDWGTKTVYFQPQSGTANDEKAYVGYVYFVPPTLDPMRLDIGNIYDWFKNPVPRSVMPISWYPRNFTNPDLNYLDQYVRLSDDALYAVQLGLYVIGYKEFKDDKLKKFRPDHRILCRLATYSNRNTFDYRWRPQEERINLFQVEQWYLNDWERMNDLYSYRFGYLKLAPVRPNELTSPQLLSGLVSAPISLHWLWTLDNQQFATTTFSQMEAQYRANFVEQKARQMCHDWYDEDGALFNFIRDVETNASCPCTEKQAKLDLGRFMPHPRCSQEFRDITCSEMIGAKNCYMSAQNIYGSYSGRDNRFFNEPQQQLRFPTHYGQVCCYDQEGFLQQTTYQPVIKIIENMHYNPGFPLRAYEFGSSPYLGQFEVPGLSAFHHDYMPYHLCCKFAKFRCQMFYWRRPSSGCQQYQPPAVGFGLGGGTFNTIDNQKFIFSEPGVYTLLYIPKTLNNPEVRIQVRLERYPNRKIDFSLLGRYMSQADLVQPTNTTVITGIAIEATGTDRVHITARGDTRRFRYRTNIIVGNLLRYFDTMRLQRFKGVLIYVNNVERGQPEIFVVLEEAEIGLRIQSMGMLDVQLSVPPRYAVRPDGDNTRDQDLRMRYNLPRVSGLLRPFPDQSTATFIQGLTINDVNSDAIRQQIINAYRIPGTGGAGSQQTAGVVGQFMPFDNMFITSREEDKKFEVFPEVSMKNTPIYRVAPKYEQGMYRFRATTGQDLIQLIQRCRDLQQNPNLGLQPLQSTLTERFGRDSCPDNPAQIVSECGDGVSCLHDYVTFNSKTLGFQMQNTWSAFETDRLDVMRQYNSCGPINIEYPEYLTKVPAFASGYLQGDVVRFDCFQTHWIHGDNEYKCGIVVDYNDPRNYRFEWNKGNQPWCRSREMENFLKYLAAILGVVFSLMVLIFIFLACWCIKQKRLGAVFETRPIRPTSVSPPFDRKYENEGFAVPPPPEGIAPGPMSPASRVSSPAPTELRQRAPGAAEEQFVGMNTSV
ncbi:AMOP domain-containing protein [Ditylenchus destructor]|nr:AMOP domain-containing protein [Ditylenchus destructor]